MNNSTKTITVKNAKGVKLTLVTKSSLLIECLSEVVAEDKRNKLIA